MYRFFVNNSQIKQNIVIIKGKDVNHIKNVLRLNLNDKIEIVDLDTNQIFICGIKSFKESYIECNIIDKYKDSNEPNVYIHVLQGIPKFEKMELIIEKCIELGASEFTPIIMRRCVVKLDGKSEEKKVERWNKIAEVAAKQSKRDIVPVINHCRNIKNICKILKNYDIVLVAYENEREYSLKKAIKNIKALKYQSYRIAIIIGPEGGIDSDEIEELVKSGFKIVSLGKRILRTETAPIAMVSNIIFELEGDDINGTKEKQ